MNKHKVTKIVNKYLKKGCVDKAIAEWEKFLDKNEGDGNTYNTIGDLYLRQNKKDQAIESFKKAADYFKTDGFMMKAMALYKKVLNIKPEDVDSIVALAELNVEKGLVSSATNNYLRAIEISMNNGETDKVIEVIEKVLAFEPDNIVMRKKVAEIYAKSDMKKHASDEYCKIAQLLNKQKDKKGAYKFYKKALEVNESAVNALKGLSMLEEEAHNIKSALHFLKKAIKISQSNDNSSFYLPLDISLKFADLSLKIDDIKSAKLVLQNVLKSEPTHRKGKLLLGKLHVKEGLIDDAWKELAGFIDESMEERNWYEALELLEPFKDAKPIEAGSRLVLIYKNSDNKEAQAEQLWLLAKNYEKAHLVREALQSYHEILMLVPDDVKCKERIEKLNEKLIDEIDEFEEAASTTLSEDTSVTKALDDSLKRVEILISYELYHDAKNILEQLKEEYPDRNEIKERYEEILSKIQKTENQGLDSAAEVMNKEKVTEEDELIQNESQHEDLTEDSNKDEQGVVIENESNIIFLDDTNKEEYEESLYEADFYAQQGLIEEAVAIYERLLSMTPDDPDIIQKLESVKSKDRVTFNSVDDMPVIVTDDDTANFSFEDEQQDEDTTGVQLDKSVMDVFQQFKESVDKEVSEDDYDTHYELGIAYREMGMLDDAIVEFRYNGNDNHKIIKSTIMIGQCYREKYLYEDALEQYSKVLHRIPENDDAYLDVQYSIAEILEKTGDSEKAAAGYKSILQKDPSFRDVSERIAQLESVTV